MDRCKLTFLLWLISSVTAFAQCVNPDFTLAPTACKNQRIYLAPDNSYDSYEWDLCSGELAATPTATVLNSSYGGYGSKLELVEFNNDYYGFFLSRGSNKLYRLDFGNNINGNPSLVDLGGLGKNSNTWRTIKIVKEGLDYIGFIVDESAVYRLNFGDSPANTPQPLETFYTGSPMNLSIDATIVKDGNDRYLFIVNAGNDRLIRIKFNSSFSEPVSLSTVDSFSVTGSVANHGVSIIKDCDKWYIVTASIVVAGVFRIALDDLSDTSPDITSYFGFDSPGGVAVVKDNNTFMVFAQGANNESRLYRLTFGPSMSGTPGAPEVLSGFGYAPNAAPLGFAMHKVKSDWLVVTAENQGSNMYRVKFPQSCASSATWSTERNPVFTTTNPGTSNITLNVTNGSGFHSSATHSFTVSGSTSPDIEFTSTNICAAHDIDFHIQNTSGDITSYAWNFGDMTSSTSPEPTHQFPIGGFNVNLTVTASSTGCTNTVVHRLVTYPKPDADFFVPPGLICTNNDFTFNNLIDDIYDGTLSYQWLVDGLQVSTTRDLVYNFNTTADKTLKLVASIPGCSGEKEKVISGLLPGPNASYNIIGQCEDEDISFQNTSTGNASSYEWDFDNGKSSTSTSATSVFNAPRTYEISLKAFASNGCVTTVKKDLIIYSKPQPSFIIDLPPFSCSGTPSQFHDVTATPTDSNIQSWNWVFGDNGSGTGKNPTHVYVNAGDYPVALSVTTDRGCTASTTQPVTITQSPTALFNVDPSCVNQPTKMFDASTGGASGWQWKIGSVIYDAKDIQHTFAASGSYSVQLSVKGQNNCTNTLTKTVVVPVVPIVSFEVRNPCAGQPAIFDDITSSVADPVVERNWAFSGATATGDEIEFIAAPGNYNAALQVKTQAGCTYNTSKQVTINPSPVASFTMSDESGPPPLHVFFTNTSTGATSYEWLFSDGSQPVTDVNTDYNYPEVGDYAVVLTAKNAFGCKTTATKVVSVIVPLNELALEDFSLIQSSANSPYRGYVRVRNNGNYRIDGFFVTYGVGGGVQLRETVVASLNKGEVGTFMLANEFLDPGPAAFLCAELVDDNDLSDNKACETFDDVAVILGPYPNPADVYLNIESILPQSGVIHVRLYTASGGLAYDKTFDAGTGLSRLSLDVRNLSPGIYVAVITVGGISSSQRVLIAR